MSIISFNWDKHFIYAIIYWVLEITVRLFMYLKWDNYFKMSDTDVQNEYIYVVLLNIADWLSGFLIIYIKCAFRNTNQSIKDTKIKEIKTSKSGNLDLIYESMEYYRSDNFHIKMIIISLLDYFSRSLYWISYSITGATNDNVSHQLQKDVVNTFDIIMRYVFSIFILKAVIHRHRIVSILIITLGFLILLPADFLLIYSKEQIEMNITLAYVSILALRAISYPLMDTLIKQIFSNNYISPEFLMFSKAWRESIIIIVLTPILYFSFGVEWRITFKIENIITLIIYTLASSVKAYFLMKIIYHFSSQSVSFLIISESVTGSISEIIYFANEKSRGPSDFILLILEMIGIFIIAFATLIYDEIIIIKKWNLEKNVKSGIISRGEMDMVKMKELELIRDSTFDEINKYSPEDDIKDKMLLEDEEIS